MKPSISLIAVAAAAAAALALPGAASAHRQWLLPSATVFSSVGDWVTIDGAASDDLFFADHQPLRLEGVKVWRPDGAEGKLQNGFTGRFRSVFDVQLDQPGTWKVGTQMSGLFGSFMVDGVEKRVGGRGGPPRPGQPAPLGVADIPASATDVKLTEMSSRNEVFLTVGEPTAGVLATTGKGLELAPITHPDELVAGQPARFRFLLDGKPAAGLKVDVLPGGKRWRDGDGKMALTTAKDGVVSVTWPTAGMYWMNATLTDANTTVPRATERRLSYVTTLEVLAP